MKSKRSNRYLKYCVRNEFLDFPYTNYTFPSSCSYKFLVSIVIATGVGDLVVSCCLMYACHEMLNMLKDLEVFNQLFPTYAATITKLFTDITVKLIGIEEEGLNIGDYQIMLRDAILTLKVSSVLLLGIALFFLILSVLLFIGIYRKNSTCCFIWNVCLCMSMIIYFLLAFIVFVFQFFELSSREVMMITTYGFYRLATIICVYRFQKKYLFFSKVNQQTTMFDHVD